MPARRDESTNAIRLPKLRRLRIERAMSQVDLAKASGVSRLTVQRIENGGLSRVSTIRKLAWALDVRPTELTGPEEADDEDSKLRAAAYG